MGTRSKPLVAEWILQRWTHEYIYTIQYVLSRCNWHSSIEIWGLPSFLFKPAGLRKSFGQQNFGRVIQCDFQSITSDTISTNSSIYGSLSPFPHLPLSTLPLEPSPPCLLRSPDHMERPHMDIPASSRSQPTDSKNLCSCEWTQDFRWTQSQAFGASSWVPRHHGAERSHPHCVLSNSQSTD